MSWTYGGELRPGQVDQADDHPLVGHPMITRRLLILVRRHSSSLAMADRRLGRAYRGGAVVESDDLSGHVGIPLHVLVSGASPRPPVAAVNVIDPANCDLEKLAGTVAPPGGLGADQGAGVP